MTEETKALETPTQFRQRGFARKYSDEDRARFFKEYKRNGQNARAAAQVAGIPHGSCTSWVRAEQAKQNKADTKVTAEQIAASLDSALEKLGIKLVGLALTKANQATLPELIDSIDKIRRLQKGVKSGKKANPETQEDVEVNEAHDQAMEILKKAQQRREQLMQNDDVQG